MNNKFSMGEPGVRLDGVALSPVPVLFVDPAGLTRV